MADGIIIQLHCAGPFGTAGYPIHIFAADGSDGLQRIDHAVYCCHTDLRVQCGSPVVNFLTAGALPLQNDIKQDSPLSGDPQAPLFQLLYNKILLHLCMSVTSCSLLIFLSFCILQSEPSFIIERTFLFPIKLVYLNFS